MSRRRKPAAPSEVENERVRIKVVCTGRGTHERVSFGYVDVFPHLRDTPQGGVSTRLLIDDGEAFFVNPEPEDPTDIVSIIQAAKQTHWTRTLLCGRCRPIRNVPMTDKTLRALVYGLAENGQTRLDLSALGAIGPL